MRANIRAAGNSLRAILSNALAAGQRVQAAPTLSSSCADLAYLISIRETNRGGVENPAMAMVHIADGFRFLLLAQPLWQEFWFRVALVLMLVGAGAGITWWILGSRHRRAREKLHRTQRQSAIIIKLSLSSGVHNGDLKAVLRDVTESAARVLRTEYAGIWLLDEAAGGLRCATEFDALAMAHNEGKVLSAEQCKTYLENLALHRSIVASDVLGDTRLVELARTYLISRKITATLDASVREGGKLAGVVCHHTTRQRQWQEDEIAFVCAIADHVSQVLVNEKRKHAEAELDRQRSELARLSRVATLAALSGSLAHELNQPLTSILCNAEAAQEYLKADPPDLDEVRSILREIADDDRRAGEVMRRLRILFDNPDMRQRPVDINETVRDTLVLAHDDLEKQKVRVETELGPNLPLVSGNQVQLQQVLLNLLSNACDAMANLSPSDRRLTVCTEVDNGCGVKISVADFGCGISQEQMQRIFQPFFTTKEKGMGLGLAVCRSIVSAHGGKLWAVNEPQHGTRFNILLPAATTASK